MRANRKHIRVGKTIWVLQLVVSDGTLDDVMFLRQAYPRSMPVTENTTNALASHFLRPVRIVMNESKMHVVPGLVFLAKNMLTSDVDMYSLDGFLVSSNDQNDPCEYFTTKNAAIQRIREILIESLGVWRIMVRDHRRYLRTPGSPLAYRLMSECEDSNKRPTKRVRAREINLLMNSLKNAPVNPAAPPIDYLHGTIEDGENW